MSKKEFYFLTSVYDTIVSAATRYLKLDTSEAFELANEFTILTKNRLNERVRGNSTNE